MVKLNCSHVALHCLHTRLKYLLFSLEKNLVCSISFTILKFWNQNNILLRILRFPAKNFEFDWLSTLTTTQLAQYLRKNYFRKMKKLQTKWRPLQLFQRLKLYFRSPLAGLTWIKWHLQALLKPKALIEARDLPFESVLEEFQSSTLVALLEATNRRRRFFMITNFKFLHCLLWSWIQKSALGPASTL